MEEATRRLAKRNKGIDAVHALDAHTDAARLRGYAIMVHGDSTEVRGHFPSTPDPDDLTTSKRSWEAGMMRWRRELQDFAGSCIATRAVPILLIHGCMARRFKHVAARVAISRHAARRAGATFADC